MVCSCRRRSRSLALFSVTFVSALVSGCVTLPEFDKVTGITPASIVQVIKCELIWARQDNKQLQDGHSPAWLAVADLTLQVDETTTLTPSFAHTDMVSRSLSRLFNWGVKLDTRAQRIYTQSVTFKIPELHDPRCANRDSIGGAGFALNGSLGLSEIVRMAFGSSQYVPTKDGGVFGPPDYKERYMAELAKADKPKAAKSKYFGQSLSFIVTKNINKVGPTWVLSFFKGPGGFLTMERGDTNKLAISFAAYEPGVKFAGPGGLGEYNAEAAAAYSNSTLLQQDSASRLNQIQQSLESF